MSRRFLDRQFFPGSLVGVLVLLASGCERSAAPERRVASIAIVSGNNQEVRDGSRLAEALAVRVTRVGGVPASGVEVVWTVAQGSGEFRSFPDERRTTPAVAITDGDGVARTYFLPSAIGQNLIAASAPRVTSSPVTFLANDKPKFEILFGPLFDCTPFTDPSTFSLNGSADMVAAVNEAVSVGYYRGLDASCTARVKTTSVPDGGEPFDTGLLHSGETFTFTPRIAGTWELRDVINGGSATLVVR